jgi:hypothetical protein
MEHLGIATSPLFQFIMKATMEGEVSVMGPAGPSAMFKTLRGIRQGCPASPILFAIIVSFLERRILRKCPTAGIHIGGHRILSVSYADDFTIVCTSFEDIEMVYTELVKGLAFLGLTSEASKCKLLTITKSGHSDNMSAIS